MDVFINDIENNEETSEKSSSSTLNSSRKWQNILATNIRSLKELSYFLNPPEEIKKILADKNDFPINIPLRLVKKMTTSVKDPIFLQFVPTTQETETNDLFSSDPLNEDAFYAGSCSIHKYESRILLNITGACAMNCRYCFRRYSNSSREAVILDKDINYIEKLTSINEVILSGGDPLALSDASLSRVIERLNNISHVKAIRFHTRFLIGIPERIDEAFLAVLRKSQKQIIFVVHCNHPKELDDDVLTAFRKLQMSGIPILSQSVLLKNVNDSVKVLKTLFETLAFSGVIPYYLHQLDRVSSAVHFEVPKEKGLTIMAALSKQLPGYAVPKYVQDVSEQSKTIIS